MALIIQESEDIKIVEVFSMNQEYTKEQTDQMALKEENEELKEVEEKNRYERHDFMAVGKSKRTERNSVRRIRPNQNLPCHQCGKHFSQRGNLNEHMKIHTGEKPFICQHCGKRFVKKGNLKEHMYVHVEEKPFTCDLCGRGFKFEEGLNNHIRSKHSGKDCFECRPCGERFSSKVKLYSHIRLHTKEKACEDAFLQAGNLQNIHTAEKTFKEFQK
ncbi:gastrula zinc finger protein XlCGF49.1-like [Labeo rohita]|uniref:gastrula zinc finger protein XlCGF49.1-like n=1 Tax=Labeo rohita TaxID=84645 RepID=UPI0021E33E49|nr:gastrula zinc finger protein XlCGF49.1-like [Labeo rohita]XP_050964051.1 gastrula zinc finger protein XlCGF49.1-like [Labeo rohita]XP_050964052.1 gastrula zinc finger protein XlCGF49.1-like [Labeo rohita]XP_050964054.1 gastrula zinc finger protein XlCGF49.1-like [Labeo rohita]